MSYPGRTIGGVEVALVVQAALLAYWRRVGATQLPRHRMPDVMPELVAAVEQALPQMPDGARWHGPPSATVETCLTVVLERAGRSDAVVSPAGPGWLPPDRCSLVVQVPPPGCRPPPG